ncbi:HigA family addiction module antitoxin [Bdellovibrionota bacterium FG-2]
MKFEKFSNPFHPGEMLLEEFLEPMNLTQSSFAEKLGWSARKLNEIIKGKRGITAASALDLADALKTTPEYWMNLQVTFDLAQAYRNREELAA